MPKKRPHPCNNPGCPQTTSSRFCPEHTKQNNKYTDSMRGSRIERGYDNNWLKLSRWHKKNNPLCVICLRDGILSPTEEVDHIIPFKGIDDPLRLDETNLQSLCKSCHSKKTATEDGGFGR